MKNLEKYDYRNKSEMNTDNLVIMDYGQLAMAIRGGDGEYCMMMNLGELFGGMCIPMGYWIVPDVEDDFKSHWILIDPVSEFWIINNVLYYNYDAIVGEVVGEFTYNY